MTLRAIRALSAISACFLVLIPQSSAQSPATLKEIGWWTDRPGASELEEGSFEIAFAPGGPISQAAVRIDVEAVQLTSALLEFTESSSESCCAEAAQILACPTDDPWKAANPGPASEAPQGDCDSRGFPISRRNTGEWAVDLSSLLEVGSNSIAIVPTSHPDTQGAPVPYRFLFMDTTLKATSPAPPPPPPTPEPAIGPLGGRSSPPTVVAPSNPPIANDPGPPPVVAPPANGAQAQEPFPSPDDEPGSARPWWRLFILVPLAGLTGAGAIFARRTLQERLGGTGE